MMKNKKNPLLIFSTILLIICVVSLGSLWICTTIGLRNDAIEDLTAYVVYGEDYAYHMAYDGNPFTAFEEVRDSEELERAFLEGIDQLTAERNISELCRMVNRLETHKYKKETLRNRLRESITGILTTAEPEDIVITMNAVLLNLDKDLSYYDDYTFFLTREFYLNVVRPLVEQAKTGGFEELYKMAHMVNSLYAYDRVLNIRSIITPEELIPHNEFASLIESLGTPAITQFGQGGYYDSLAAHFERTGSVDSNGNLHSSSSSLMGDFLVSRSSTRWYRPTGEDWEEELLSEYDSHNTYVYYKGESIIDSETLLSALRNGVAYVFDVDGRPAFAVIEPDRIVVVDYACYALEY